MGPINISGRSNSEPIIIEADKLAEADDTVKVGDTLIKLGAGQGDRVVKYADNSDISQPLTGVVTIKKLDDGGWMIQVSVDPGQPALSKLNPNQIDVDSWFNGFLAVMTKLITEIINVQKEIKVVEKETEIDARKASFQHTLETKDDIIKRGDLAAEEKRLEAFKAVVEMTVSAVQAAFAYRNERKAQQDSKIQELSQHTQEAKVNAQQAKAQLDAYDANHQVAAGDPQAIQQARANDPARQPLAKAVEETRQDYKLAHREEQAAIRTKIETLNHQTQLIENILQKTFSAAFSLIQAGIETEKATIDAHMEITRAFKQFEEKYGDIASSAYAGTGSVIGSAVDLQMKLSQKH